MNNLKDILGKLYNKEIEPRKAEEQIIEFLKKHKPYSVFFLNKKKKEERKRLWAVNDDEALKLIKKIDPKATYICLNDKAC